jgi:aspartate kinase
MGVSVFKFGGASVKDADAVRNLKSILATHGNAPLVVVVSAMDKTTNHLESVVHAFMDQSDWKTKLEEVFTFHLNTLKAMLPNGGEETKATLDKVKQYALASLAQDDLNDYDFIYDQIVSIGEILSTKIIAGYLAEEGVAIDWWDARKLVHTDNRYRHAKVNWGSTEERIEEAWNERKNDLVITQGFIGGGEHNRMTTLGREGSDFSAAIFAYALNAESVTIWKDVPGMLNADPKYFSNTDLLANFSYREAIELSYFGASVIHPKTIKPLENKHIPLWVKSFRSPDEPGSLINDNTSEDSKVPSYIFKADQVLISISTRDFSFMVEEHLSDLFQRFSKFGITIQTMQNSAISFSVSVAHQGKQLEALIEDLSKDYQVRYNEGLELMTIRHYNTEVVAELIKWKEVLLEQKTRHTMRVLMRSAGQQ